MLLVTTEVAIFSIVTQLVNYDIALAAAPESSPEDFEPEVERPASSSTDQISDMSCYKKLEINNITGTTAYIVSERYSPSNIVDSNYTTFWWINNYSDPSAGVTMELKERTNICRIDIAWLDTASAIFTISVSNDGTVFEPAASYADYDIGQTFFEKYNIPDILAKYVKLSFSTSTGLKIREANLYNH